jgi:hypothetical protein
MLATGHDFSVVGATYAEHRGDDFSGGSATTTNIGRMPELVTGMLPLIGLIE